MNMTGTYVEAYNPNNWIKLKCAFKMYADV